MDRPAEARVGCGGFGAWRERGGDCPKEISTLGRSKDGARRFERRIGGARGTASTRADLLDLQLGETPWSIADFILLRRCKLHQRTRF
jgi:hypothetical protein